MPFDWDSIDTDVAPALDRLDEYNSGAYNVSTNPHGLAGGGHISQFPAALLDLTTVANAFPEFANLMEGYADAADASATTASAAAANLTATSTTSLALTTGSKSVTTQADKTFPAGSFLLLSSNANPTTHWMVIQLTSYVGTTLQGTVRAFRGSGSRADWTIRLTGMPALPGILMVWSTDTTNTDPTSGKIKVNNATLSSASALYVSETDFDGNSIGSLLATWDDSTSTTRGRLFIVQSTERTNFLVLDITSSVTDNGTWDSFACSHVASGGTIADGAMLSIAFLPQANKGDAGAQGIQGIQGIQGTTGRAAGLAYVFSTNTSSSDPAAGRIKFNNATPASVTEIYISETDNEANNIAALIASFDDSTSTIRGRIEVRDPTSPTKGCIFNITGAIVDNGTWATLTVGHVSGATLPDNAANVTVTCAPKGDKGDTGTSGSAGSTGPAGPTTAPTWIFDNVDTSDSNPGTNKFKLNNATIGSVTKAFINDTGLGSADMTAYVLSWDDSTNSTHRGTLFIVQATDPTKWALFTVGTVTDDGSYLDVALTYVAGPGGFTDEAECAFAFSRSGNAGAGSGDVVGPASVTDGRFALFDGGTGKLIKEHTGVPGALAVLNTVGASQIDANAVTNAKLDTMAQGTTKGRAAGAGTGDPTDRTDAQLKDDMAFVKGDVGLGNVDNTSDANKPVSTAQAAVNLIKKFVSVRVATTANITIATALNNGDSLDGVTLADGDLVLVKNQSSAAENGIYVVGSSPARHGEYDAFVDYPGAVVSVQDGTANADTSWRCTSNAGGTIDSTALAFTQDDITAYTAGNGLVLTTKEFSVNTSYAFTWAAAHTFLNSSGIKILDTNASHSLGLVVGSDLTADRTLTIAPGDASRSITLGGNISTAGAFTLSGAFGATFTFSGTTTVTFPTSGTLATTAAASDTVAGLVELATAAETTTGTDATRAITPDGLAGSNYGKSVIQIAVSDPNASSAITTGDGKAYVRIPAALNGYNLIAVAASVTTVSSSGTPTIQLRRVRAGSPVDMLSTRITIDANESDSSTAAAAAVINASNDDVATADFIHVDIDVAGTGTKGLNVEMTFQLP